jgi:hypothetical protein
MAAVGAGFDSGAGAVDCASAPDSNKPLNAVTVASVLTIVCLHSPFQKKTSRLNNSRRKWPFRQRVTQKKLLKDGTIVVVGASAPKNQTIS